MEVIYTGLRQTPEQIVAAAAQEDVDVVGLSVLSGAHMHLVPRVIELLAAKGMADVSVFVGGIIPPADAEQLKAGGVAGIFPPGTDTADVVTHVLERVGEVRARPPNRHRARP